MVKVYYDAVLGCTGWDFGKVKKDLASKKRKRKPQSVREVRTFRQYD
jgi:hypothetical protein